MAVVDTVSLGVSTGPEALLFDPAGQRLYIAEYGADQVAVIDPTTNQVSGAFTVGRGPLGLSFVDTGAGPELYVMNGDDNTVGIYDASDGSPLGTSRSDRPPFAWQRARAAAASTSPTTVTTR